MSSANFAARPDMSGARPKLSVIIPCYNEADTIAKIVGAVRATPYEPVEIIVIDDCSTDGTREILSGALRGQIDHESKRATLRTGFCTTVAPDTEGQKIWLGASRTGHLMHFQLRLR